jgi:hypothetical protein
MLKRGLMFALALTLVRAAPALAQLPGIELSPFVGAFVPLTDLVDEGGINLTVSQKDALAVGGRVKVKFPGPLGVEGTFLYAFSDVESDDAGDVVDVDASVWAASGKLVYTFGLPMVPVSFNTSGGVALVSHNPDVEDAESETDVGGVVGVGLRLDPPGLLAVRLDVEDYLYSFQAEGEEGDALGDSQFQSDLVVSVGLVFELGL